jgi:hypothetical protein
MQVFIGFSWCVPSAFQDAIDTCFFKVGDVLYSNPAAYQATWKDALKKVRWSMQVKETFTATVGDGEPSFEANWKRAKVTGDLTEYGSGKGVSRLVATTQGRLYQTLVKGDPSTLESEDSFPPQKCRGGLREMPTYVPLEQETGAPSLTDPAFQRRARASVPEAAENAELVQGTLF